MERALDKIIKYGLYLLVFLFPLWFLPWTISPFVINKQVFLSIFVFLLLIFWMIKIIITGKLNLTYSKLNIALISLLSVLIISTIFSSSRIQSFWGMGFEPGTLFSFILYILVFFLFANLINESGARCLISVFLASSGILALLFLVQIFKPVFPWDFSLNPIGSVQALAVFLGGALVILISFISVNQRINQRKISGIILGILLFISIFLINFWVAWLGIAFGLAIIIFSMLKNLSATPSSMAVNPLKSLFLPLFIFILALVFIFLKLPIGNIISLPSEISPTYKATFDIATETLKESPKNLILGSGPATFGYQYSLHRSTGPNLTDFWQIRFDQGIIFLLTILTTSGVLGLLAILTMITIFFWQGFTRPSFAEQNFGGLAAFAGGFYFLISWFFYSVNFSLMFAAFLMLGLFSASSQRINQRQISVLFTQSPRKAFLLMLVCTVLIVGSVLGLYNISQKYAGAVIYAKGLSLINAEEPKLDEGIININKATTLDAKDVYFRNLSQAFLLKINEIINNQELSQEQRQTQLQRHVSNAEISANNAVLVNPRNSQNWFQLGNVYENLATLNIEGADQLAISSYQKTAELDPQNPLIPFNLGRVYFATGQLDKAKGELQKSIELKNDFQPALNLLQQIEAAGE